MLGLRVRGVGLRQRGVVRAIDKDRALVRTWLMRGTLHLVAAEDLRWMLSLLGPLFARGNRARHRQLGLDDDLKARGVRAIREILAQAGPLSRGEIVASLQRFGIHLDPKTQGPIHLIAHAAMQGVCCLGPEREKGESTYVLLDDWIPADRSRHGGVGEFASRYFDAFAPATVEDFASWSGLPMPIARSAVIDILPELEQVAIGTQAAFLPKGRLHGLVRGSGERSLRLIPAFDTYLLGYQSRDLAVEPGVRQRLQRGGGWLHPAVLVDGRAIGAWTLRRSGRDAAVVVEARSSAINRQELEAEVHDIEHFLAVRIAVELAGVSRGKRGS